MGPGIRSEALRVLKHPSRGFYRGDCTKENAARQVSAARIVGSRLTNSRAAAAC
jgi:hypothetical protein